MNRSTVYVATPITGMPDMNLEMVRWAARLLTVLGYSPILPHDIDAHEHDGPCPEADTYPGVTGQEHAGLCYLRADLKVLLDCSMVVALPGWQKSRGASVEVNLAESVGIPVRYYWPESDTIGTVPLEP